METLEWILNKINGKKTSIATILGAILVFVQGRGYIATDTATLISGIFVALGVGANIANSRQ